MLLINSCPANVKLLKAKSRRVGKKVWNMFKVNNKVSIINFDHDVSRVSIVDFELVNVFGMEKFEARMKRNRREYCENHLNCML